MSNLRCKNCGSYAVNDHMHGREKNADLDLCDVCYWRTRAEKDAARLDWLDTKAEEIRALFSQSGIKREPVTSVNLHSIRDLRKAIDKAIGEQL